jgi:DNA-binding transcriptional regulator GbsR (MarR family)
MVSVLMTQIESLIKVAELVEPKAFLKLEGFPEKAALVKEKYVRTCSEVEEQLRNVLKQVQEKSPDPDLEAKLTQAINRLEELKKPYI